MVSRALRGLLRSVTQAVQRPVSWWEAWFPRPAPPLALALDWGLPVRDDLDLDDARDDDDPAVWFAVPKKRRSKSRKRMRTWMLGPKPIVHTYKCPDCGKAKKYHHIWKCCIEVMEEHTRQEKLRLSEKLRLGEKDPQNLRLAIGESSSSSDGEKKPRQ
mmetsp:Transcript_5572/g.23152  ORF Transcript_5572/g.23152 Transcript_5572/m.23152 type:complete len:159 (+) Transcript_5572:42-518(+)